MEKSKGSSCVDSDAQPHERLRIFISYSRVDSEFAYRLRADLEVSGFSVWIDTAKLGAEGGQEWLRIIQDAVSTCQAMLVVVSPDSVQSRYVHMEYHFAQLQQKLVIPLHYRTVSSVPIDLSLDQWIEFREGQSNEDIYAIGLANIIQSLSRAPIPPKIVTIPQAQPTAPDPLTIADGIDGIDAPVFGPVPPPPPLPAPNIQELIAGIYDARGKHDLVGEEFFLRKVVESGDPAISPSFTARLKDVSRQLETQRIKGLQALAQDAVSQRQWRRALGAWQALLSVSPTDQSAQRGIRQARVERAKEALKDHEFDEAIGAWQALLKSGPSSSAAQTGLRAALRARAADAWSRADWNRAAESWETLLGLTPAEPFAERYLQALAQNRQQTFVYEMVRSLHQAGNIAAARAALEDLYSAAPYYGDPANLAADLGVVPRETLDRELELQKRKAAEVEQQRKAVENKQKGRVAKSNNFPGIVFYAIPGNAVGIVVVAAVRADMWWTGQMLQSSLEFLALWIAALILVFLLVFGILPMKVGSPDEIKGNNSDRLIKGNIAFGCMLTGLVFASWGTSLLLFHLSLSITNVAFIIGAGLAGDLLEVLTVLLAVWLWQLTH
jgi:DNA-binding SARP family transcriptional activator